MKRLILFLCLVAPLSTYAQLITETVMSADKIMPVRRLCIEALSPAGLDRFVKFIDEELAPGNVNTLILRVDYNYHYESYPNLRDSSTLSRADVKNLSWSAGSTTRQGKDYQTECFKAFYEEISKLIPTIK